MNVCVCLCGSVFFGVVRFLAVFLNAVQMAGKKKETPSQASTKTSSGAAPDGTPMETVLDSSVAQMKARTLFIKWDKVWEVSSEVAIHWGIGTTSNLVTKCLFVVVCNSNTYLDSL